MTNAINTDLVIDLSSCPICGAAVMGSWDSGSGLSHFVKYECGFEMRDQVADPGWKQNCFTHCRNAYAAVLKLRSELAAARSNLKWLQELEIEQK